MHLDDCRHCAATALVLQLQKTGHHFRNTKGVCLADCCNPPKETNMKQTQIKKPKPVQKPADDDTNERDIEVLMYGRKLPW